MSLALLDMIRQEVVVGNVNEQTHPQFPELSIFKYSETCAFDKLWNPINRICRGLILNTNTGNIVARSFPKFFNLGEMPESMLEHLPNEDFEVLDKIDGSMGSLYVRPDGEWAVATPGSMDSDQAREATKMLSKYATTLIPRSCTPVCEIIYPENRVVVDYGDKRELVLLAIFNHDGTEWPRSHVMQLASQCGFPMVRKYVTIDLHSPKFSDNQEGYVIRFRSGLRIKIKSPVYVMAHRFLTNISIPRVIEGCRDGSIAAVMSQVPDTWKDKLDDLVTLVNNRFGKINAEVRGLWQKVACVKPQNPPCHDIRVWRKECAEWIKAHVQDSYQAGVFMLLSNKDPTEFIWKVTEEELKNEKSI
jgi:RNA ligase